MTTGSSMSYCFWPPVVVMYSVTLPMFFTLSPFMMSFFPMRRGLELAMTSLVLFTTEISFIPFFLMLMRLLNLSSPSPPSPVWDICSMLTCMAVESSSVWCLTSSISSFSALANRMRRKAIERKQSDTTGIIDGYAHLKGRDVVLLHPHGRDLRHVAGEGFVFEGFNANARGLSQINLADVALVNFALDVNFAGIAQRHHQRRARAEDKNRADRIAHFHVTRQHHAIDRRR